MKIFKDLYLLLLNYLQARHLTAYESYLSKAHKIAKEFSFEKSDIPSKNTPEEGLYIKESENRLELYSIERGISQLEFIGEPENLLFDVFSNLCFQKAAKIEILNRKYDQDYRRIIFEEQLKLLKDIDPTWAIRQAIEINKSLINAPYDDHYDQRKALQEQLIKDGLDPDRAKIQALNRFPLQGNNLCEPKQLIEDLQVEILETGKHSSSVASVRIEHLSKIKEFLELKGFPHWKEDKMKLSLFPYYMQEANYDDINWSEQAADLGHLNRIFDIDFKVQNSGCSRSDATSRTFNRYLILCRESLNFRKIKGSDAS